MTDASTTSRPLFNRQQLISLFLPLVAEQALSISIGLADTLMVSSVGEAAVSGVSLVDSFNVLMIQLLSALATGGAVVASQYIGHREPKRAKASAAQIMFIMISLSVVTAVIVAVGRHAILRGIFGSIDADVMRYAETYFLLSALSYPFIGVYNAGAALFRAQGNSKISMLSSLVMNVVNIGGNAILIYRFGMGVMGAATASLVSRMIACFTVMFLLQKPDCTLGTAAIAANAVAGNISSFLNVPASAVGIGALTVVGQCLGAGEKVQAKRYSRLLLLTAYAGDWLMNLSGLFFLNKLALSWFNLSPDAYGMALELMVWFNAVSLILWPSSFTLPNILRAAGDAAFTMTVSVISMWVFRVAFCYLMVLKFHCGLLFIWMGMFLDWAMRSLFFCVRFVRGRWMEQKVI